MEGRAGIEPANTGFADPRVTTSPPAPYQRTQHFMTLRLPPDSGQNSKIRPKRNQAKNRKPTSQFRFWRWVRWRRRLVKCFSPDLSSRQNADARSNRLRRDNTFRRSWGQTTSLRKCSTRLAGGQGDGGIHKAFTKADVGDLCGIHVIPGPQMRGTGGTHDCCG